MSGQITTVIPEEIEFQFKCDEVGYYLENRDFEYIELEDKYQKVVQQGKLVITVSFNEISKTIFVVVGYRDKKRSGEPEVFESSNISDIMDFVIEFDSE